MILAIDVGNTHIVIGMIEQGEIRSLVRLHTDPRETATELIIKLRQITDYYGLKPTELEGSILSSVVPRVTQAMKTALETLTGRRAMLVGPGIKTGLNLRIDEPASVARMDGFLREQGYENDFGSGRLHHEIYLSDARKVAPEKWKTVIRHPVRKAIGH